MYTVVIKAGTATISTCHVIEAIITIIVRSSTPQAATKVNAYGISKSNVLKSDEACQRKRSQIHVE